MAKIRSDEDLWEWLQGKPREVAALLAARAALRILPLWRALLPEIDAEARAAFLLPIFRAKVVALVAGTGPTRAKDVRVAAADARRAAADAAARAADVVVVVARAAYAAADAGFTAADAAYAAARAADAAAHAAAFASADATAVFAAAEDDVWAALSADCAFLDEVGTDDLPARAEALAALPLWFSHVIDIRKLGSEIWASTPVWAIENWQSLRRSLNAVNGEHWVVWTRWYQDRLDGKPYDKALEEARVLIPEDLWKQGPAAVNAELQRVIDRHRRVPKPEAVERQMPQGRSIEIDRSTGRIAARPAAPRTEAPETISNTAVLDNFRRKLRRRIEGFQARPPQYRIGDVIEVLREAVDSGNSEPLALHDDFEDAVADIDNLIRVGDLPQLAQAPELAGLRRELVKAVADLRVVYPALQEMADARRRATLRPLTPAEEQAMEAALDAFEEIVEERLRAELAEDLEAVKAKDAEIEEAEIALPEGPLKARIYKLIGTFAKIYRIARTPAERLVQIFDAGVNAVKKIESYQKTAEKLGPLWQNLSDILQTILQMGGL